MVGKSEDGNAKTYPVQATSDSFGGKRARPPYEKILLGPLMVFANLLTGGHFLGVLCVRKQLSPPTATYPQIIQDLVAESGWLGAFYRGFVPWGTILCAKGLPVLFIQSEVMHRARLAGLERTKAEALGGVLGGIGQGILVTPLNRLRVSVISDQKLNAMGPLRGMQEVIRQQGIGSLFNGIGPTVTRRGCDWGLRFYGSVLAEQYLDRFFLQEEGTAPSLAHRVASGFLGGALSALTHPIDCIVVNCQRPAATGVKMDAFTVVKQMYSERGIGAFSQGLLVKILDNGYHTMWMYGVSAVLYAKMAEFLNHRKQQ